MGLVVVFVAVFAGAALVFGLAVWFGLFIAAPRIKRALDRAEVDEETGDRPD